MSFALWYLLIKHVFISSSGCQLSTPFIFSFYSVNKMKIFTLCAHVLIYFCISYFSSLFSVKVPFVRKITLYSETSINKHDRKPFTQSMRNSTLLSPQPPLSPAGQANCKCMWRSWLSPGKFLPVSLKFCLGTNKNANSIHIFMTLL